VDSETTAGVPAAAGLCAYRVVQEALTNAAKHAPGAAVAVSVHTGDGTLVVRVDDDGPGTTVGEDRPRYGLVGLRERVTAAGGTFTAGRRPDAPGWRVTARLPLGEKEAP
jgi:signal transduction histidine kinase